MAQDPTEQVQCGKCNAVNTVPFGLDKFKCFSCGSMVAISREPSSACAAASSTAMYYNGLEASSTNSNSMSATSPPAPSTDSKTKPEESGGFFSKMQRRMSSQMDVALKKVDNMLPTKPADTNQRLPQQPAPLGSPPQIGATAGKPAMSLEEEQLQWALSASLSQSHPSAASSSPGVLVGQPPGALPTAIGAQPSVPMGQPGAPRSVPAQAVPTFEALEEAERELSAAQVGEAAAISQLNQLQEHFLESQALIKALTEQIDDVNAKFEAKCLECKSLQEEVVKANQAAALTQASSRAKAEEAFEGEMDGQGTIAQLLARISELESTLLQATHFAPDPASQGPSSAVPQDNADSAGLAEADLHKSDAEQVELAIAQVMQMTAAESSELTGSAPGISASAESSKPEQSTSAAAAAPAAASASIESVTASAEVVQAVETNAGQQDVSASKTDFQPPPRGATAAGAAAAEEF